MRTKGCIPIEIDGSRAIICGSPITDHNCDDKKTVYEFSDGFYGTLFEKARMEGLCLQMCEDDMLYFLHKRDITIRSMSVACSVCGRAAIDDINYLP